MENGGPCESVASYFFPQNFPRDVVVWLCSNNISHLSLCGSIVKNQQQRLRRNPPPFLCTVTHSSLSLSLSLSPFPYLWSFTRRGERDPFGWSVNGCASPSPLLSPCIVLSWFRIRQKRRREREYECDKPTPPLPP